MNVRTDFPGPPPVILLCGGRGSRVGLSKGLIRVEGQPWLLHQLDRLAQARLSEIVIVLGHTSDRYLQEFAFLDLTGPTQWNSLQIRTCLNAQPDLGQFSSLQTGLRSRGSGAAFLLPVDSPAPTDPALWQTLAQAMGPDTLAAIPRYEGQGGHPVLLSQELGELVLLLSPEGSRLDQVLGSWQDRAPTRIAQVPVQTPLALGNLNLPADWARLGASL